MNNYWRNLAQELIYKFVNDVGHGMNVVDSIAEWLEANDRASRHTSVSSLPHREVIGDECAIDGCPYERDGNSMYCADHKVSASVS